MKRVLWILVFILGIVPAVIAKEQGKYLVRLDDRLPVSAAAIAKKLGRAHGVEITHVYSAVFNGFAFNGSPKAARAISRSRHVSRVEAAPEFRVMSTTQAPIPAAGLDRLDERAGAFGADNAYTYNETGYGSVIYVLDTGVNPVPELAGRIIGNISYVPTDQTTTDCGANGGHGTSVATVAAGSTHGVAKQASIVNMKVIRCKSKHPGAVLDEGAGADILAALNDVANWHNPNQRSIVNLSGAYKGTDQPGWCLDIPGCNFRNLIADAANNLVTRGITVVTAVPNPGQPPHPCGNEPTARGGIVDGIISVSKSTVGDTLDPDAGLGVCVDIFAPAPVLASGAQGDEVSFGNSSAATALVSGVAALIQERQPSIATNPGAIETQIKNNASHGVLVGPLNGSPNRVAYSLPSVTLTMPASLIQNQTFTASTPAVSGATYQWKVINATILSGQGTPSVSIRAGVCAQSRTMAAVTVTAGTTKSTGFALAPIPKPTAHAHGNAWISAGQSADIYANLSGAGPWTVTWSDGFTHTVTSSPAVHTVSPMETTYYTLDSVQDPGGCYATKSGYASVFVE